MSDASTTRMEGDIFTIARRFAAPRAMVFAAWTEADQLKRWFGPKGSTMPACTMDLRPGGFFHYCLEMPGGVVLWGRWVFREILAPERIVLVQSFSDAAGGETRHPWDANWPLHILSTTTFQEADGGTLVTVRWQPHEATALERKTFVEGFQSMTGGWGGTFDNLDTYLTKP